MSFGIIYKVENKINGKIYIGQTVRSLKERIRKHCTSKHKTHFHNALSKYGKSGFDWSILEECSSQEELNCRETYYIDEYKSLECGYNMVCGGGVMTGWTHSDKTKEIISNKAKKRLRENGHPNRGKKWSKEIKKRMSDGMKGRIISEKQRKEHSDRMKGCGNPMYGVKSPMYGVKGKEHHLSKKYVITTPEGVEFLIHGLNEFCNEYKKEKLNTSRLALCAKGVATHNRNYKCRYYDENNDRDIAPWRSVK